MKQIVFFLGIILIGASCTESDTAKQKEIKQTLTDTANFTTVEWVDTLKNFGTINKGEKADIQFHCKNTGNKPLIFVNVRPGCGCTVADYTKKPIAPGSEGIITATFDSKMAHSPDVRKQVMVTYNVADGTEKVLTFEGKVNGIESNDKIVLPNPSKEHK
jgi:hypothetical protein